MPRLLPLLTHELDVAKILVARGVAKTLVEAVEICIRHSSKGPFTPREVELLRKAAQHEDQAQSNAQQA